MGSSLGSEEEGLAWPRGASGMRGQLRSLGGGAPSLLASGRPRTEENKAGRDLGWRREAEQTPGGNIQQARGDRAGYGPGESPSRVEPGFPNLGRLWQDRGRWESPQLSSCLCFQSQPFCMDVVPWAYWQDGGDLLGGLDNLELASPPPPAPTGLSPGVPGPASPRGFPFPIPLSFQGGISPLWPGRAPAPSLGHRNVTWGGGSSADSLAEVGPDQGISPLTDRAA